MKKDLVKSINKQINLELYSAYLYFSMSNWAEQNNLKGIGNWFRIQAQEEMFHGTYMYDFLLRRNEVPELFEIDKPYFSWENCLDAFKNALEHEKIVTREINNIADMAMKEKDHGTYNFFLIYVDEQIEEEETANDIISKLELSELKPELIYAIDKELGERTYTQPFGNID